MTTDTATSPDTQVPQSRADVLLAKVLYRSEGTEDYTPEERKAVIKAYNERAHHDLKFFGRTMTQGDWLKITRILDMTREEIGEDQNLVLLAFAYVKEKRNHGRASMDVLLELTDRDLLAFHGFAHDPDAEDDDEDDDTDD